MPAQAQAQARARQTLAARPPEVLAHLDALLDDDMTPCDVQANAYPLLVLIGTETVWRVLIPRSSPRDCHNGSTAMCGTNPDMAISASMNNDLLLIGQIIRSERAAVLEAWLDEIRASASLGGSTKTLGADAEKLLDGLELGLRDGQEPANFSGFEWENLKEALEDISQSGAAQGNTAAQTSSFVLAFKKPLFERIHSQLSGDPARMATGIWAVSTLIDSISQYTLEIYQRSREGVIVRQQQELLELSTPVVKLWEGVLAVPMIGTLDSSRTQLVMESLLQRIVDTGSELAIIDITGVPTVDTLVAQHLLKTVTAIRLMGADCIISGVRPQIAQTIVHLGIDLQGITTKASLADALALALKRGGYVVTRPKG